MHNTKYRTSLQNELKIDISWIIRLNTRQLAHKRANIRRIR